MTGSLIVQVICMTGCEIAHDIHRTAIRERLRSVSTSAMAFFWVYERLWSLVVGVVAPRVRFWQVLEAGIRFLRMATGRLRAFSVS